ncbi:S8 family serine peptidase [Catellatospora sp. NPDC049609]|uniref:S8 family serine peptidase n=1 Tax=Catellatospora sp. NPDC049609 TaxID=3155505 RepID=UPI003419C3DC
MAGTPGRNNGKHKQQPEPEPQPAGQEQVEQQDKPGPVTDRGGPGPDQPPRVTQPFTLSPGGDEGGPAVVGEWAVRYLLAPGYSRGGADVDVLCGQVEQISGLQVADALAPAADVRTASVCPPVVVVQASPQRIGELAASGTWQVELDQPLLAPAAAGPGPLTVADPGLLAAGAQEVSVVVRDGDDQPVEGAAVFAHSPWPAFGTTDSDGRAVLVLPAGCAQAVSVLVVQPRSGYWSRLITAPQLSASADNLVPVRSLEQDFEGLSGRAVAGWAAQELRIGQLPPNYRGRGVKIAIVDSGIAADHPEFDGRISHGVNVSSDVAGWDVDTLGSGTASAGVIAAADDDRGITGLACDAEIHAVKALPGTMASLLKAIDYCITHGVDVALLNTALPAGSQLLAAKLLDARNAGVVVVAPAGDTPGPVAVPAGLPEVVAVGALGRAGVFPPCSIHPAHLATTLPGRDGLTPAAFTPTGPGVDVAAPGVAVLTCAVDGGYTVRDGTTLAAAHIAALAALALAHHEDFQHAFAQRGPDRVDRLHRLLAAACRPVADPARTGAGVPDARRALGVATPLETDFETAVLHHLQQDLTRAGLLPQPD